MTVGHALTTLESQSICAVFACTYPPSKFTFKTGTVLADHQRLYWKITLNNDLDYAVPLSGNELKQEREGFRYDLLKLVLNTT